MSEPAAVNLFTLDDVTATQLCVALADVAAPGPWTAHPQTLRIDAPPAPIASRRRMFGLLAAAPTPSASSTRPCAVVSRDHALWLQRAETARTRSVYLRPALFESTETARELVAPHAAARGKLRDLIALDARLARCEQIPLEHVYGADDPAARDSLARIGLDPTQVALGGGGDGAALYVQALEAMLEGLAETLAPPVSAMSELIARVAPATIIALTGPDGPDAAAVEAAAQAVGFVGVIQTPPLGHVESALATLDPTGARVVLTLALHPSRLSEAPELTRDRPLGISLRRGEDAPYSLLVAAAQGGLAAEFTETFAAFFAT